MTVFTPILYIRAVEKFEVTILGCGSALPTLRHNGSAQIVNIREKYFLVDCAEGTQVHLRSNHIHLSRMNTIFISHLHGDHCFGLTGLISTQGLLGRTAPLHIYGPEDIEGVFRPLLDYFCNGMEFEVVFHPVDTHQFLPVYEDRSVTVYSIPLKHRIRCCGYLFREKPLLPHIRREAIEHYQIPVSQINNIKAGADFVTNEGVVVPNSELVIQREPPRSYAYCSDTMFKPENAELLHGVNLLYHEATFADAEEKLCARVFHSTARQAAQMAQLSHAQRLVIGHFSSRYEDENILLKEAQSVFPNTILAHEKMTITL